MSRDVRLYVHDTAAAQLSPDMMCYDALPDQTIHGSALVYTSRTRRANSWKNDDRHDASKHHSQDDAALVHKDGSPTEILRLRHAPDDTVDGA